MWKSEQKLLLLLLEAHVGSGMQTPLQFLANADSWVARFKEGGGCSEEKSFKNPKYNSFFDLPYHNITPVYQSTTQVK